MPRDEIPMPSRITPLREIGDGDRVPTLVDAEIEQALLASLLTRNHLYEQVVEKVDLQPRHFGIGVHGRMFDVIGKLIDRGGVANAHTLAVYFDQDQTLADIGGADYVAKVAAADAITLNVAHYAEQIRDLAERRAWRAICRYSADDAEHVNLDRPLADIREDFDRHIIAEVGDGAADAPKPIAVAIDEAIETAGRTFKGVKGITTGLTDLDKKLGGLFNSDLTIIAAATAMGKTTLALGIAVAAARAGYQVYFGSQEMSAEQLAQRTIAVWRHAGRRARDTGRRRHAAPAAAAAPA